MREMKNTALIKPHVLLVAQGQALLGLDAPHGHSWAGLGWAGHPHGHRDKGQGGGSSAHPSWAPGKGAGAPQGENHGEGTVMLCRSKAEPPPALPACDRLPLLKDLIPGLVSPQICYFWSLSLVLICFLSPATPQPSFSEQLQTKHFEIVLRPAGSSIKTQVGIPGGERAVLAPGQFQLCQLPCLCSREHPRCVQPHKREEGMQSSGKKGELR